MLKTRKWDMVDYLQTELAIKRYLETVFEEGDPQYIATALGNVAKARGLMSKAAKKAGVARESLYRSLSKDGRPGFNTIISVVNSLGYRLTVAPQKKAGQLRSDCQTVASMVRQAHQPGPQ